MALYTPTSCTPYLYLPSFLYPQLLCGRGGGPGILKLPQPLPVYSALRAYQLTTLPHSLFARARTSAWTARHHAAGGTRRQAGAAGDMAPRNTCAPRRSQLCERMNILWHGVRAACRVRLAARAGDGQRGVTYRLPLYRYACSGSSLVWRVWFNAQIWMFYGSAVGSGGEAPATTGRQLLLPANNNKSRMAWRRRFSLPASCSGSPWRTFVARRHFRHPSPPLSLPDY